MPLQFPDQSPFATGASEYHYHPATEVETVPRIFVKVRIEGVPTEGVIDTGGMYFICDPILASRLRLEPEQGIGTESIVIRGQGYRGTLHRVTLTFLAEEGESMDVEATAFVPLIYAEEEWTLPNFLGMYCCMERCRFAVDPDKQRFYFGPV